MPTQFTGSEPEITPDSNDTMFGATPVWDRSRKRGMFGGKRAPARAAEATPAPRPAEPRSFAEPPADYSTMGPAETDMILDRPMAADEPLQTGPTVTNSTLAAEEAPMAAPISRPAATHTTVRRSGASPAMIAGGVAALALIGVGGWYLARPHDGVPELAPGQPSTTEVAAAPAMASPEQPADVDRATNTLPSRAGPARAAPRQIAQASPRVRPAARASAPSATAAGVNASAVLPEGPRPYSALNPSAPTQVTPPPAPAPAQTSPTPSEAAPAIPQTPPVEPPASQSPPAEPTPPSA